MKSLKIGEWLKQLNHHVTTGVERVLRNHGGRVGRHPYLFLLGPLLISGLIMLGVLRARANQDVRELFTPSDAQSHYEYHVANEYFRDENGLFDMMILIRARDGGSLLRPGYPNRILNLISYLSDNFSISDTDNNNSGDKKRLYTFGQDLRINHQNDNDLLIMILTDLASNANGRTIFKLTYPVINHNGESYYVGNILGGIKTDPIYNLVTEMESVVVNFRSARGDDHHYDLLKKWTREFLHPDSIYDDPLLSFTPWNDHLLTRELLRVSTVVIPYVIVSFCVLIAFAVAASTTGHWVTSKPWEALAGVVTVGLASSSSFGLLFLIGYSYVGTLAVMPVLVLAMGLDVTFIVLRNWQSTNVGADPEHRLAETWAESGASVVITSLTNIMSTAIGAFTNTPAIHVFCLSTTIAVFFLFFYQITFFAAILALGGRREAKSLNSVLCCFRMAPKGQGVKSQQVQKPKPDAVVVSIDKIFPMAFHKPRRNSENGSSHHHHHHTSIRVLNDDWWHKFSQKLANLLTHPYARGVITLTLLAYWVTALWGCLKLEVGLSPEKLFLPDSPVLTTVREDRTNVLVNVFVMKAPNFTRANDTKLFYEMVKEFETIPECLGPESTSLWLRPFENYLAIFDTDRQDFYKTVPEFLSAASFSHWRNYLTLVDAAVDESSSSKSSKHDVIGDESSAVNDVINGTSESTTTAPTALAIQQQPPPSDPYVPRFFFSVAYKRAKDWKQRVYFTDVFRLIAEKYEPYFNVSTYVQDNNNFVVDQLHAIPSNTAQDVIITGLCMAVICVLFIPNCFNTACAMITIFSINLGVFGYLVHWNVALDPVSMTSLLMSIGYSVDFTSHISYHYYSSAGDDPREKLVNALSSIGLPMIETGFSTVLSVGCLCLVPSYLVWVYFKTTLLVVMLGLFHGILVLPAFLAWLPEDAWNWIYKGENGQSQKSTDLATVRVSHPDPPPKSPNPDIVQISIREGQNDDSKDAEGAQ